jgi:hypothetical protein
MYQTKGNFYYFIEDSFAHDDIILPISGKAQRLQEEIQQIDKFRSAKPSQAGSDQRRLSDMEQDMVNVMITPHKSTDGIKKASTFKIHSSATRVSDGSKDTKSDSDNGVSVTATETMFKRW